MKKRIALLLAALLLAAVPAAYAADLSVLDDAVYEIKAFEQYTSVFTTLSAGDVALPHAHALPDHPTHMYGELIIAGDAGGGERILWCWNLCYLAAEPVHIRSVTVTAGGRDFTLDVADNTQDEVLENGIVKEWTYAFMGEDNAQLWLLLVLEGTVRETAGSFEGWTMPMVIRGESEDVETELTTGVLVDLYATYKAMAQLEATDQLRDYHGTPLISVE